MSSSRLRRAKSADRLTSGRSRRDYDHLPTTGPAASKCDLVGFPYCFTKHYHAYRRWPYYLDPVDYPYYQRYGSGSLRLRNWPDWPYYGDYYQRRPWYYYDDDYYGDYLRGYAEGMRKFDSSGTSSSVQRKPSSGTGDLLATSYVDKYPYAWWYYRPYNYRRYL